MCAFDLDCIILRQSGLIYGPQREKTCLRGFSKYKGADQPAHLLESIITNLAQAKFHYILARL